MKRILYIFLLIFLLCVGIAYFINGKAIDAPSSVALLPDSPWVLEQTTDIEGANIYAACASCHMADGSGRSDGDVPRLTDQSENILVDKLQKLRNGTSFLPVMTPFARALTTEEVEKVARYISLLPNTQPHTEPPTTGDNNEAPLSYQRYCSSCHGATGQGNDRLLAPRLCQQHAPYLIRRMHEIKLNLRGDADLAMMSILNIVDHDIQIQIAQWLATTQCDSEQPIEGDEHVQ